MDNGQAYSTYPDDYHILTEEEGRVILDLMLSVVRLYLTQRIEGDLRHTYSANRRRGLDG
jgi:hypothetical protein